jgi:hypothetical protein
MPAIRDILVHVEIQVAQRARICYRSRNGCGVPKNQTCLVIYEDTGGRKNYCPPHALEIVTAAKAKLAELESVLRKANS